METREHVFYRGEKFWIQSSGRYFQSGRKGAPERLLHRKIWCDHHGSIPENYEVHHRDGNWRNNAISNLELRRKGEHQSEHMLIRSADPAIRKQLLATLSLAREAASRWHKSSDGRAWHKLHGKRMWKNRTQHSAVCEKCGEQFQTYWPSKARFCSSSCSQSVYFRTYFTDRRICAWCGKEFMANRHRKTACCSYACANRKRAADKNL